MPLRSALSLAVMTVVAACATTTRPAADAFMPIARGDAASFSALVPASAGSPRCEARDEGGLRRITLVREGRVTQRVSVVLDPDGAPVRYIDARRAGTGDDASVDRTTIGAYLAEGYVVAGNQRAGQPLEAVEMGLDEAMASASLGTPSEMLQRVLALCAAGT